jgi:sarcosine/dimethylglycine N-methyltransferase
MAEVDLSTTNSLEEKKDDEREVWEFMTPLAWHNSIAQGDSVFIDTYKATRDQVVQTAEKGDYDVIVEVGCGTGDVIGELDTKIQCYGLDINREFLDFCRENHPHDHCDFHEADALHLVDWWKNMGFFEKFKKPLITCVNNTLNIMPEHLRGGVVEQMLALAGDDGMCMVSYWNGNFFSHAIMNYYKKNPNLCGNFEVHKHVDWEKRCLLSPTNYSTEWHYPVEVQQLLRAFDVDVENIEPEVQYGKTHINCEGLSVFVWFDRTNTSDAKAYYDSDDAQKFYHNIWGEDNLHVGRYDLIEDSSLSAIEQVAKAQEFHELEFIKLLKNMTNTEVPMRIVDLGCGYGGLLRRLWKEGIVWNAQGVDLSARMCAQARRLNAQMGCEKDITILEESYLDVSVPNESCDVVISMDALLHVGPNGQKRAMQEASRILRPGGWIIFSDIMQEESLADPDSMKAIYERINLSEMGTISNYEAALEKNGFSNFSSTLFSDNVSTHYGNVLEVLQANGPALGISEEYQTKAEAGLNVWKGSSKGNIVWGFLAAQKTRKI